MQIVDYRFRISMGLRSRRFYSEDVAHLPAIQDPELQIAFKDLMAASWDNLPDSVIHDAKAASSKNTDDTAGKEIVANVFRAAEAVEEFSGMLVNLKMELDDSIGMSGEVLFMLDWSFSFLFTLQCSHSLMY